MSLLGGERKLATPWRSEIVEDFGDEKKKKTGGGYK